MLLLAVSVAPAEAGFRYVPAAEGGAAVTIPLEAERADPAPGSGPPLWRIRAGETLRQALSRWAERAGAEVTFLTDRRYRLDAAAAFEGGFGDAATALLRGLAHLPHPPAGTLSADGRSLVVTHRARHAGQGEDGQ